MRTAIAVLTIVLALVSLFFAPGGSRDARASRGLPAIAACTGAGEIDFTCYQRRYRAMVPRLGAGAAIRDLAARGDRVGYVRVACHQLMHGIGRDAGKRFGIRAFEEGDDSCSSGFHHGVVESVMSRMGAREAGRHPARVCERFRGRRGQDLALYNCIHGMGHGFMGVFATDVFRSVEGCDALPVRWERRHCVGGVFMENLTAMSNPERPSRELRPEEPLYPCTAVARRFKHECYIKQTAYALHLRDYDFGAAFALCARTPDVAFRPDCYEGLGGDASIRASKFVTGGAARRATVRSLCRLGRDRSARRGCVVGAVTVTVRDGASRSANPVAFCQSFREDYLRAACSRAHLKTVQEFAPEPAVGEAGAGEQRHSPRLLCRTAAQLEAAAAPGPEPRPRRDSQ